MSSFEEYSQTFRSLQELLNLLQKYGIDSKDKLEKIIKEWKDLKNENRKLQDYYTRLQESYQELVMKYAKFEELYRDVLNCGYVEQELKNLKKLWNSERIIFQYNMPVKDMLLKLKLQK